MNMPLVITVGSLTLAALILGLLVTIANWDLLKADNNKDKPTSDKLN